MSRLAFTLAVLATSISPALADGIGPSEDIGPADRSATDRFAPVELRIAPSAIDRAQLRAKLLEARRANLAAFHAYRIGRIYPSNVFTGSLANIWRDNGGHYCAAATIIRASGATALAAQIAEDNNFFRIADVEQGPVMDWILTSGLTQAELVMIQKPFAPVAARPGLEPTPATATATAPVLAPPPPPLPTIDPARRRAETLRLAKLYRTIEQKLAQQQRASIELAVDRLMQRPDLAHQLLSVGSENTVAQRKNLSGSRDPA